MLITDPPPNSFIIFIREKKYTWYVTPDTWHVTPDMWHMAHDMLQMAGGRSWTFFKNFGSLALTVGELQVTCDIWHVTPDTGHVTHEMCDMTHRGGWPLCQILKSWDPTGFMMFWRLRGNGPLNQLISDKGVCRTAPATLGLLIIKLGFLPWLWC